MAISRRLPELTPARIERAWRGQPIDAPDDPEGPPPPPPLSNTARRINWALAIAVGVLGLVVAAAIMLRLSLAVSFGALGAAFVVLALIALRTQRMVGLTFRSRFIARREREPVLYWSSLILLAGWGAFVASISFWSLIGAR
jgi:hypothetical protein